MPVPRRLRALEDQHGAVVGRDFGGIILEVVAVAEDAQPTHLLRPLAIEIEQDGDDLVLAVGVDLTILGARVTAQRIHLRPAGELDAELLLDHFLEFAAVEIGDHVLDQHVRGQAFDRERTARGDRRERIVHALDGLLAHDVGDDRVVVGVMLDLCVLQPIDVEISHLSLFALLVFHVCARAVPTVDSANSRPIPRAGVATLASGPGMRY